jgi:hypothetical protein
MIRKFRVCLMRRKYPAHYVLSIAPEIEQFYQVDLIEGVTVMYLTRPVARLFIPSEIDLSNHKHHSPSRIRILKISFVAKVS